MTGTDQSGATDVVPPTPAPVVSRPVQGRDDVNALSARLAAIEASTIWQSTALLRAAGWAVPEPLRRVVRLAIRTTWWAATPHRLPERIRAFVKLRRDRRGRLGSDGSGSLPGSLANAPGHSQSSRVDLALVTANFGGIDNVKPLPAVSFTANYYTEAETLAAADPEVLASWPSVVVPNYPRGDFNPRLRARYFKHQIHRLPEARGRRWLAWADANVTIHDPSFLVDAVARLSALPASKRVLLIPHPHRKTVREEFLAIEEAIRNGSEYLRLRYAEEKMPEQMAYFASQGWNLDGPLWCGTVWLVENSPIINRCWDEWWDQNLRFGMMDQLSLTMVLEHHGIEPQAADFRLDDNPFFTWGTHARLV